MPNLIPRVKGRVCTLTTINGKVRNLPIHGSIGTSVKYPMYEGPTVISPSTETQLLFTKYKNVNDNITILPVTDVLQVKMITPSVHKTLFTYPDEGYIGMSTAIVWKVPYEEQDNVLGGKTAIIGSPE